MRLLRSTALLALLLAAVPAWAVDPFNADYAASWKGVEANAQITLASVGGNRWSYTLDISNKLGSARQATTFAWNRARDSDGRRTAASKAMMATTTRTSINVKARDRLPGRREGIEAVAFMGRSSPVVAGISQKEKVAPPFSFGLLRT